MRLFRFLGRETEADFPVERNNIYLDVEAFAVLVFPGAADARPESLTACTFAHVVSDVAWLFGSGGWCVVFCSHGKSPFLVCGLAPLAA